MPFERKRLLNILNREEISYLQELGRSRTEAAQRIERAKIILSYSDGVSVSVIARQLQTNRSKTDRCVDKVLQLGLMDAFPLGIKEGIEQVGNPIKPQEYLKKGRMFVGNFVGHILDLVMLK